MRRELYGLVGGIAATVILGVLSWVKGSEAFFIQTAGWAGSASLIIGALISGNFLTGDRVRQHQANESKQDRKNRRTAAGVLIGFSLPLLAADLLVSLW
ncbi:hypothetical protein EJP77_10095 [Paenibacillus zeisoli]|uniref:DUF5316 domain-containing protein n=1 Tax=Paenibacillus zeisoli TaxID=2496267 RepID=A0A3S1D997_9BACL|nr:DUF5316 family protein [Paenibacillus zeisoli]RUT31730.1 hypothetical protein EJP77_10095 [Paenibacillus zeisoli]